MNSGEAAAKQGVEVQASWKAIRRSKTAFTIKELVGLSSDFSKHRQDGSKRTSGCTARVLRTERSKFLMVYNVTCTEKDSNPAGHTVRLKFDFKRLKESGKASDLDVRVSCSCPAFLYWGAQWNLSTGDALYGAPRPKFQPPTEPRRYQYVVCKHVQLVADRVAPLVERMLEAYRTPEDDAEERERQKQVEVVKQRTQLDVDKKEDELKGKEEAPAVEEKPSRKPITPKTEEPTDDLDAMPEDLTTLGLPPKPAEPAQGPKRKPITPKEPVEPEKPVVPQTEPEPGPTKPEEQAPTPKKRRPGPRPKQRREEWPSNIKLVDDEDQETTVLPGSKARPMVRDEDWRDAEFFPKAEGVPPASKARRMVEPKKAPGKPKLPPNIQLIDDDSDDYVTKINRLKQAGLLLATAEV